MAEAGVEASGEGVAANGKVGKNAGGGSDEQFVSEEGGKATSVVEGEKVEMHDAAETDGNELKPESETKEERKAEKDRKEEDGEMKVRKEEEGQEKDEEEPVKKKRGRKPKGSKDTATPEVGSKLDNTAKLPETEGKRRKISTEEPLTPIDRPSRERKSIDRFVASIERDKVRGIHILKGSGTPLKDIPNVAYNLSKRSKADAALSSLHAILYGGHRVKGTVIKNNIMQFSGYVWGENQEKDKAKVKEKLDRFTKEGLLTVASILDIKVSKTGIRKEELVLTVLEFLESPHQTTDELLEEKEQELKGKRRRSLTPAKRGRGRPSKKEKIDDSPAKSEQRKQQSLEKESDEEAFEEEEEEIDARAYHKDADEDEFEGKKTPTKKITKSKASLVASKEQKSSERREKKKNLKTPPKPPSISKVNFKKEITKATAEKESAKSKVLVQKDKKDKELKKGVKREVRGKSGIESKAAEKVPSKSTVVRKPAPSAVEKQSGRDTSNQTGKSGAKGKEQVKPDKPALAYPTDDQLRAEICELLQDADFSTVTFTDVVKQLEAKFNVSLLERKAHVKVLIREELSKIVEEGEDGEEKNEEQPGHKSEMDAKKA